MEPHPHPNPHGDISHCQAWAQQQFELQMMSWLDFALANRYNNKYLKCQTARRESHTLSTRKGRNHPSVGSYGKKAHMNENVKPGITRLPPRSYPGQRRWRPINNHMLYNDWVAWFRETHDYGHNSHGQKITKKSIWVKWVDAMPEMHAYFDFIDDQQP